MPSYMHNQVENATVTRVRQFSCTHPYFPLAAPILTEKVNAGKSGGKTARIVRVGSDRVVMSSQDGDAHDVKRALERWTRVKDWTISPVKSHVPVRKEITFSPEPVNSMPLSFTREKLAGDEAESKICDLVKCIVPGAIAERLDGKTEIDIPTLLPARNGLPPKQIMLQVKAALPENEHSGFICMDAPDVTRYFEMPDKYGVPFYVVQLSKDKSTFHAATPKRIAELCEAAGWRDGMRDYPYALISLLNEPLDADTLLLS